MNRDELENLKRITDYIRQTRADLASELARLEELDISKVVPNPRFSHQTVSYNYEWTDHCAI